MLGVLLALTISQTTPPPQANPQQGPPPQTTPPTTTQTPPPAAQTPPATPGQAPATQVAAPPPVQPFIKQVVVAEPMRLALTPKIDGKLDPEEWDLLAKDDQATTYFQWQPDAVHLAATIPAGQDIIFSVDGHGDGWLVGRDNLEIRVHFNGNTPQVTERLLDNTPLSGSVWADAANFMAATVSAGSGDDKTRTVELTVTDPGLDAFPNAPDHMMGIRYDLVPESMAPADPMLPRVMAPVHLTFNRGKDLPAGFEWKPEMIGRSVVPGESTKIRLTFHGNNDLNLRRVDMQTAGLGRDVTTSEGVPFPKFDAKDRAFVDYHAKVTRDAAFGFRELKANVVDDKGHTSLVETSYEIAPYVSFDFVEKGNYAASQEPQKVRLTAYIHSNTIRRVDGVFRVQIPDGWKIDGGSDRSFIIYNPRGGKRQVFSVVIPGGFKGTAPIKLVADFVGESVTKTIYINVN